MAKRKKETVLMNRHEVAEVLREVAVMLELKGENPFKVRAYSNAVRILEGLQEDLGHLVYSKKLGDIKGIGATLQDNITELVQTGRLEFHDMLRDEFPEGLFDVLRVPGLGPKKVKVLYEKLKIKSLGDLEYACEENRLLRLDGFGAKTQDKVLSGIQFLKKNRGRFLYADVIDIANTVVQSVSAWKEVKRASLAGSLRRGKEIVKDVDLVASASNPKIVMNKFAKMKGVTQIVAKGDTKTSVLLDIGLQVDLRVVTDKQFPYALHHFTGSKEHNTEMRTKAKQAGLKMNEYGLFKGKSLVPCEDEAEIFKALKMEYIPPELRENQGEIEAAEKKKVPDLVALKDLKGFFHVHSTYSDGRNSLEEMVKEASTMGIEYVGLSDHSQTAFYANGLKAADIERQHKEIELLQKKYPNVKLFRGIESDILPDGSLDYPEKILQKFDFVIGSVHASFTLSEDKMTQRCIKALKNPYCTILGHPTGRLLLARDGFKINMHRIIDCAAEYGKIVELNANPHRLDVDWRLLSYAKKKGVPIAIDPDAHSVDGLKDVEYGVAIARKGWLTKKDVFNTLPLKQMEKALARIRAH